MHASTCNTLSTCALKVLCVYMSSVTFALVLFFTILTQSTLIKVKRGTLCYSSLMFYSFPCRSECLVLNSLFTPLLPAAMRSFCTQQIYEIVEIHLCLGIPTYPQWLKSRAYMHVNYTQKWKPTDVSQSTAPTLYVGEVKVGKWQRGFWKPSCSYWVFISWKGFKGQTHRQKGLKVNII